MAMHPYFDPLCPGVPDTGIASHAVISNLTSRLETAWPDRDFLPETLTTVASYVAASPFLQRLAIRHSADIGPCLAGDAAKRFDSAQADFRAAMADVKTDAAAMATIRQWRGRSALIVALADLAGLALVSDQIRMLSDAADSALGETIGYLYRQAALRGKLAMPAADMRDCGWTVLALG
jgi:glutamine synthetase adenylyltransferase